ncbi:MAG: metallophosphoesterase [Deltaproteobacteria bacterium]|nr:metallophosphoesterase [Deltaproteobacteria bacterium]
MRRLSRSEQKRSVPKRWRAALVASALACGAAGCRGEVEDLSVCLPGAKPALSLLAVGDTGDRPEWLSVLDQNLVVGRVMAQEQRRRPAAALLLLGDNFYSEGLLANEAVQRVRGNVVKPFCSFVASGGPRWEEVADACAVPPADRTPIPIIAVLGNHDHNTAESPHLQRTLVREFVSNWDMPPEIAAVREIGHGVSLIVVDSEALDRGADPAPLSNALLAAKGPWRIVVGHHPIGLADVGFRRAFANAVAATGVPVQLLLAGHEHNLQIAVAEFPFPALTAIAGSGSRIRGERYGVLGSQFVAVDAGFARIDLDGDGPAQRLVVSLIETPDDGLDFWSPTRVLGCWSVGVDGRVSGGERRP